MPSWIRMPHEVSGTATSGAHAMREPSYACTMNVRPSTSAEVPPVLTDIVPLAAPDADELYVTLVHGSDVIPPA